MDANPAETPQGRVRLALITIQVLFGVNYLASKIVVDVMEPGAWAALRTLSAFVVLAGLLLVKRRRLPGLRDSLLLGVAALFGVALNQGLFLEGLHRTTVGRASLICSLIPIFVLLFSVLMGQERVTLRKGLGFAAGLLGILILLEADRFRFDGHYLAGDLLVLANAACYGFYLVFSKPVMKRNDPLAATTVVFLFGATGMFLYGGSDLLQTPARVFSPELLAVMAYVVLGATVGTYFLNLWAIKRTQASRVAIYIFLQPLLAVVLGVVFRGEEVTLRFLAATALVFVALVLRDRPARQASTGSLGS